MIEDQKKYWFLLPPYVYVNTKSDTILLYNTENGDYMEITSPVCRDMIIEAWKDENLGAMEPSNKLREIPEVFEFIIKASQKKIIKIIEAKPERPKPLVLLSILNLQRDIDRLIEYGHEYFIGEDILHYLLQLNIHVNSDCRALCNHCDNSCPAQKEAEVLNCLLKLYPIFYHRSSILLRESEPDGSCVILDSYDYEYNLWINAKNIPDNKSWMECALNHTIEILQLQTNINRPDNR